MPKIKPIVVLIAYLFILYILAVLLNGSSGFVYQELVRSSALFLGFVGSYMGVQVFRGKPLQWANVLITFFILILLADSNATVWQMFLLGLITTIFKLFVRIQNHPLINPAVISLVVMSSLGLVATWWGVSFSPRFTEIGISSAMALTFPVGLYIAWKYQELPTFVATTLSFAVGMILLTGAFPWRLLFEGTFMFFLLIMATEPKTTPLMDNQEWLFGILLGSSLVASFVYNLPLPFLLNLLVLNIGFTVWKYYGYKKLMAKVAQK